MMLELNISAPVLRGGESSVGAVFFLSVALELLRR
jgi:hypothetical protein